MLLEPNYFRLLFLVLRAKGQFFFVENNSFEKEKTL